MSLGKIATPSIKEVYNTTVKSVKNYPAVFVPFITFAIFEFIALIILYLAPRMPLRLIFGPAIRTFWGERFLHYPLNFMLLPKLTSLARMGLSIVLGSLLTGMAVAIVCDVYHKKHLNLKTSLNTALKKYVFLLVVVFLFTFSFYLLTKIIGTVVTRYFISGHTRLLFLGPNIWFGPLLLSINFILALLIQSAFIYSIPLIIIEKEKLIRSIIRSFILFKKLFIPTIVLVGLPLLLYIPIMVLQFNTAFLINRVFPEIILLVSVLGIIISSLIMDSLVTISTAILFLKYREK